MLNVYDQYGHIILEVDECSIYGKKHYSVQYSGNDYAFDTKKEAEGFVAKVKNEEARVCIARKYRHAVEIGDPEKMRRIEAEAEHFGIGLNDLNEMVLEVYRYEGAPV